MKLAESWVGEPTTRLYDEYDELDESKDGCGGVWWWKYVLKEPGTSNKMLHELARDVRGVELKRGKPLTLAQYKTIYSKWEEPSLRFLRKGHDYFIEFLSKLSLVTMPKGETLESALKRARRREPPSKVSLVSNKGLRSLASLCRELQEMFGDQPIMLCQTAIAELFKVSQPTVSEWIRALRTLEVLKLAEPAIPNCRAARYYFIE